MLLLLATVAANILAQQSPTEIDRTYLHGKWCYGANAWSSFDSTTRQVNMSSGADRPRMNLSFLVNHRNQIFLQAPNGSRLGVMSVTKVDLRTMSVSFLGHTDTWRRC